ncbi:beta-phosphoglucomutase family hydrolase [Aeromicrobium sp.]|uniref:HAD family hydrolase n=1 Tax=Aeromicrobium sp. TaxID=1871063 RepID=UPI0028A7E9C6|nr:beta-phosphoglucomutase family hydrolase [Aeromicrobium sp.]
MDWNDYDAALFDLDGVITPTAEVHQRAWGRMFTDFLADHPDAEPYGDDDYFAYVDGKPRYEGVQSFLESRGIDLPYGDPSDDPAEQTVCALGNRKNDYFSDVLRTDGVEAYPGSVALLDALEERGVKAALVSSSRNARKVIEAAGVAERFEVVIDGEVAAAEGIAGKPRPDTYSAAAERLGVPTTRSVVLEDAVSGVQAGAAGDFGLVVGVDRGAGAETLRRNGADIVVSDLAELL